MPSYTGQPKIRFYQVAALETWLEYRVINAQSSRGNWSDEKALRVARSHTQYPWTDFNAGRMLDWVRNWINTEELK